MKYEEIFSRLYAFIGKDSDFYKKSTEEAYDCMIEWLNEGISEPYIRKIFSTITVDDIEMILTYELVDSFEGDDESNKRLVINYLAQYMKICWMREKIDSALNLAVQIGGKEEKKIRDNYKTNIDRIDALELKLKKDIRDHGYNNGNYIGGV